MNDLTWDAMEPKPTRETTIPLKTSYTREITCEYFECHTVCSCLPCMFFIEVFECFMLKTSIDPSAKIHSFDQESFKALQTHYTNALELLFINNRHVHAFFHRVNFTKLMNMNLNSIISKQFMNSRKKLLYFILYTLQIWCTTRTKKNTVSFIEDRMVRWKKYQWIYWSSAKLIAGLNTSTVVSPSFYEGQRERT